MASSEFYKCNRSYSDDICEDQDMGEAGFLNLNGVLSKNIVKNQLIGIGDFSKKVTITSANNLSDVNFTINGFLNGLEVSETIEGPNNNTIALNSCFSIIKSVYCDDACEGVFLGTRNEGFSKWFQFNKYCSYPALSVCVDVLVNNINYTLEATLDDVNNVNDEDIRSVFYPAPNMIGAITTQFCGIYYPMTFCRLRLNDESDNIGSLIVSFLQQGLT